MAELLPDGLVVVGADRRVRYVNAEALRVLDVDDVAVLVGRPVAEALPLTDKYGRDWWSHADPWEGPVEPHRPPREAASSARAATTCCSPRATCASGAPGQERVERVLLGLRDAEARPARRA